LPEIRPSIPDLPNTFLMGKTGFIGFKSTLPRSVHTSAQSFHLGHRKVWNTGPTTTTVVTLQGIYYSAKM